MTDLPTSTDQAVLREQLVELLTGAHAHAAVKGALAGLEPAGELALIFVGRLANTCIEGTARFARSSATT